MKRTERDEDQAAFSLPVGHDCGASSVDGILNIRKPAGKTSFGVVALVRKLTGCPRVGHAGTLDPDATGVLLLCLGKATRMAGTLSDLPKTYKAEIQLGIATDTYDASGQVTHRGDATVVGLEQVERALNSFRGVIRQKPPMYSALKVHGRRLYEIARSGDEIEVANREVQVFHLELMTWAPPVLNLEIECSKGTYIRSIAHDLGKELKCGAHLRRLIRTSCGSFSNEDSISLPQLEHACEIGYWQRFLHSMDSAVLHWTSIILGASEERLVRTGRTLMLPLLQKEGLEATVGNYRGQKSQILCRAYTVDGDFLAILEYDPENGGWHPRRVFSGCNRQPGSEHCADVYMLPVR